MTKKDYELIAKVLNNCNAKDCSWQDHSGYPTDGNLAEAMATELAKTNPKFDRERFLQACEVTK